MGYLVKRDMGQSSKNSFFVRTSSRIVLLTSKGLSFISACHHMLFEFVCICIFKFNANSLLYKIMLSVLLIVINTYHSITTNEILCFNMVEYFIYFLHLFEKKNNFCISHKININTCGEGLRSRSAIKFQVQCFVKCFALRRPNLNKSINFKVSSIGLHCCLPKGSYIKYASSRSAMFKLSLEFELLTRLLRRSEEAR